jgi:hypothetical protein
LILDLYSEPFAASGGIDARSARRAIGKPTVGFWELFLRETLQNSWDARREPRITYEVSGRTLDAHQMTLLREVVFQEIPANAYSLRSRLSVRRFRLLIVADSGTRGLGGATRADIAPPAGQSTDFVDFVRNIGRAETKRVGGGTYGFGKGVLYDASDVDSCIIYSQTLIDGEVENRFICVSVGDELVSNGNRLTGRHWWGVMGENGILEPLTGAAARSLAIELGLTSLGPQDTGTSIAVIDPILTDSYTLPKVVKALSEAALLWAWPHMLDKDSGGPTITFRFSVDGEQIPVPDPVSHPQFAQFARAFERASNVLTSGRAMDEWPWVGKVLQSQRPPVKLGALAYRSYTPPAGLSTVDFPRHIALMRDPLFIVKYMEVQEDANGQALAGVFVVHPEQNLLFSKAEPVAHDDWIPASLGLESGETNRVRLALNKIRDEFKSRISHDVEVVGEEHSTGVAHLSRQMGTLLTSVSGHGAEIESRQGRAAPTRSARGRSSGIMVHQDSEIQMLSMGRSRVACFSFSIATATGVDLSKFSIKASPVVVLEGGSTEVDVPAGGEAPELVGWYYNEEQFASTPSVSLSRIRPGTHVVRVAQPLGVAIALDLKVESADEVG